MSVELNPDINFLWAKAVHRGFSVCEQPTDGVRKICGEKMDVNRMDRRSGECTILLFLSIPVVILLHHLFPGAANAPHDKPNVD